MPITLGTSLVAKGNPGGKLREVVEQGINEAALTGAGQTGSIQRAQIEQPLERPVSPGSEKIVSATPALEGGVVTPMDVDPLNAGIGLPSGAVARPGANAQALFQGNPGNQAASPGRPNPGAAPQVRAMNAAPANVATAYRPPAPQGDVMGASTAQPAQPSQQNQQVQGGSNIRTQAVVKPLIGTLGGKVYADAPSNKPVVVQKPVQATTGQYLAGGAGRAISAVGNAINSPAVKNVGNQLQSFGGQRPQGDIRGSVATAASNLRSQAANVVNSLLRSLTGGKKK